MAVTQDEITQQSLPRHIAIIMDGNGRWAQSKGKPRVFGHKQGVQSVREAVKFCRQLNIESLTLFAFSSENWRRPEQEVSTLMELFMFVLTNEIKRLDKNNVKLKIIGDISGFSDKLQKRAFEAEEITANNNGLTLNVAANYGGQWDIVQAAKSLATQVEAGKVSAASIDESLFSKQLSMADQAPLDLLIRTGGDLRISNFLLWQAAYAELYFTETLWPDFNEQAFADAIACYVSRERRFGCTGEQIKELLAQT